MGKIDTSGWKEFRVGELFAAERGKVKNIQPLCPGETPIIAAGAYNQGIAGMYEIDSAYENRITISCNGAGCGSTFYHPYKFNVNGDAITLIEKNSMSDKAKSFIACILNGAFTRKYSYEEKCSPQKALDEIVRLPSTPNGAPDWAYMESYMANLETKVDESLTLLQAAKDAEKKKVDTREWREFRVGELFDIKRPAARSEKKYCEGEINYVSSGAFNNGVANKLMPLPNELLDRGGCITVSPLDGSSFYQEEDFLGRGGSGASILILYNSHLNKNNALFICSVIRSSANGFGYTDLLNGENLKSLTIKLPMDKTGQPDWAYMEKYMRKVEERVKVTIRELKVSLSTK